MLDSTVVITAERMGQTAYEMLEAVAKQAGDQQIAISVVTVLELSHGLMRADTLQRRAARQRFLDDLLAGMPVYPVTIAIAMRAGEIDGRLQTAGETIALADLLIGATALELGHAVGTGNLRHFERIPGLIVKKL